MPKRGVEALPPDVEKELAEVTKTIRHAFFLASEGRPKHEALAEITGSRGLLDPGLEAAYKAGKDKLPASRMARVVTFEEIIATRLRDLRQDNGWTQAEFAAEVMRSTRLQWKRGTVAEIENGLRKVSLGELFSLADAFGKPMVDFLLPKEDEVLTVQTELADRPVRHDAARELILGETGARG